MNIFLFYYPQVSLGNTLGLAFKDLNDSINIVCYFLKSVYSKINRL